MTLPDATPVRINQPKRLYVDYICPFGVLCWFLLVPPLILSWNKLLRCSRYPTWFFKAVISKCLVFFGVGKAARFSTNMCFFFPLLFWRSAASVSSCREQRYALAWASCSWATGAVYFESPRQPRLLDLHGRFWPTIAHLATRAGDLGGLRSIQGQSFCASPRPNQHPLQSNEGVLPRPNLSKSWWPHHPPPQPLVVKLRLWRTSNRQHRKFLVLARECRIVHLYFVRWQQHCHHSGGALYEDRLRKPGCMLVPHPRLGCCIVRLYYLRWQQHFHHCAEALYEHCLQKPGCMLVPPPRLGCCIVHRYYLRWQQHFHHCAEALYAHHLQKPGCMLVPHPRLGCCIVHRYYLRWQQHFHHCAEALYEQVSACRNLGVC